MLLWLCPEGAFTYVWHGPCPPHACLPIAKPFSCPALQLNPGASCSAQRRIGVLKPYSGRHVALCGSLLQHTNLIGAHVAVSLD